MKPKYLQINRLKPNDIVEFDCFGYHYKVKVESLKPINFPHPRKGKNGIRAVWFKSDDGIISEGGFFPGPTKITRSK